MEIQIQALAYNYKNGPSILRDLSANFSHGNIYGILAPNGRGKTTFINLLMDFLSPKAGQILLSEDLKIKDFSLVQGGDKNLYMKNTVEENVYFFSILKGLKEGQIKENIDRYKEIFYFYDEIKDALCESLSHGQKRMVAIFIALVSQAKVLILDEATEGLDMENINILKNLILSVHRDRIVIVVSHDYDFVEEICQIIYYLKDGSFLKGDSSLGLRENYQKIFSGGKANA
ncbi:MAG: ABC transporter ATP-binding protein [Bacillota bacterium]|nr:ABC transporter ATP-binding protein [Bacillota bacterium]